MADVFEPYVFRATDAYEAYVGRWSRLLAEAFLAWFAVPTASRWLDVGCGTGALTDAILAATDPIAVVGIDPSPEFLNAAQRRIADPRARFAVGDARALPVSSDSFDTVVAGLVLNFVPDPALAVAEMVRAARPGGAAGAYVWDFRGQMQGAQYFWAAVAATDADATTLDPRPHFHSCEPEPLAELFRAAGLADVVVDAIDLPMAFRDLDDFWQPHTMAGAAVAQRYVSGLDDGRKAALREQLRVTLPFAADGSLHLTDRAWAVRGTIGAIAPSVTSGLSQTSRHPPGTPRTGNVSGGSFVGTVRLGPFLMPDATLTVVATRAVVAISASGPWAFLLGTAIELHAGATALTLQPYQLSLAPEASPAGAATPEVRH